MGKIINQENYTLTIMIERTRERCGEKIDSSATTRRPQTTRNTHDCDRDRDTRIAGNNAFRFTDVWILWLCKIYTRSYSIESL
jgi:uncharacterized protein (DUF849 family)